jgi:hypothetical protein
MSRGLIRLPDAYLSAGAPRDPASIHRPPPRVAVKRIKNLPHELRIFIHLLCYQ